MWREIDPVWRLVFAVVSVSALIGFFVGVAVV
jgi:hypothetical protein